MDGRSPIGWRVLCDRSSRCRQASAFTLVELVLVLAILSVVAVMAVPRYHNAVDRYQARLGVYQLATELELARDLARQQSLTVTVRLDQNLNTITIEPLAHPNHPDQPYVRVLNDPPHDVFLVRANFDGADYVEFDAFGQASAPGAIVITASTSRARLSLSHPDARVTIYHD